VALVGEAAEHHEQKDGMPFRPWAEAGAVLANCIRNIGLPRDSYLITNTVWWQPYNNQLVGMPWEEEAKGICREWNQQLFRERGIKCLVALGATAFYELTGRTEFQVLRDRGFVYQSKPEYGGLPVILTYHPSFLARGSKEKSQETGAKTEKAQGGGMALLSVLIRDIKLAIALAHKGITSKDLGNKVPHIQDYRAIAGTGQHGYVLNAGPADWDWMIEDAKANQELAISYDYETNFTYSATDESEYDHAMREVNQVQASLRPGQAIVSGWEPWVLEKLTLLLECTNDKLDYNGRGFDRHYNDAMLIKRIDGHLGLWVKEVQELVEKSIPVGNYHDLMQMWHHWEPDLPQGLQFACSMIPEISLMGAWKYLIGQDERFYGAMDVDYPQRLWKWLKKNLAGLSHPVSKVTLLQGYRRQVNELSAKSLDQMQRRGMPVDDGERMQIWRHLQGLKKTKIAEIQQLIPDHLRPGKQPLGLKTVPLWLRKQGPEVVEAATQAKVAFHPVSGKRFELREIKLKNSPVPVERWVELKDFNPDSPYQIRAYIKWKRAEEIKRLLDKPCRHGLGYQRAQDCPDCQARAEEVAKWKVPTKFRSDDETTDKKELRRLNTRLKDPVLELGIEYKEIGKMAGTYVGGPSEGTPEWEAIVKKAQAKAKANGSIKIKFPTKGWQPDPKTGRVHPFFTTAPATGQLSSRNPNAQNFPKHNQTFAMMLRGMVKAPPGYRIIEGDFKSFHVLTTGFEANDPLYMRLARLDMHSFFTATRLVNIYQADELVKMSDQDMMRLFEELKGDKKPRYKIAASPDPVNFKFVRDKQGKPTILGYGFGMGPGRLWHENQEFIASKADAERIVRSLDEAFPITCRWREEIQDRAHQQGYLVSAHGYVRRFNCVRRYKPLHRLEAPKWGWKVLTDKQGMRWRVESGDDAEAAIAFLPANDAFGRIKEAMIDLEDCGAGEEFGICNQIHDSLVAVCRDGLEKAAIKVMQRKMQEESRYLILPGGKGLECEAEFSISGLGESWAQCKEIKGLEEWLAS
jgi:uracil-DNA glycosylase family 4